MRGKEGRARLNIAVLRITPAYAGKSKKSYTMSYKTGDHPRICGEKSAHGTMHR